MKKNTQAGFTLIEVMVVIALIAILSAVGYASFADARAQARDKTRLASLQELQLAIELYKDKYGKYPVAGCTRGAGWVGPGTHNAAWGNQLDCPNYIVGLVPEFMSALPRDPKNELVVDQGFLYKVSADWKSYKVLVHMSVESALVTSYNNDFARCPKDYDIDPCDNVPQNKTYGVYSAGAEAW